MSERKEYSGDCMSDLDSYYEGRFNRTDLWVKAEDLSPEEEKRYLELRKIIFGKDV